MAGALDRMSRLTVEYTSERRQFGRAVAQFQAVQQHLVRGAEEAALVDRGGGRGRREPIAARPPSRSRRRRCWPGRRRRTATRAAHQAHGAIGMTQEYPLQHLSRRLWSWRREYGGDTWWSARLGRASAGAGADALYPSITGGSSVLAV